MTILSPGQQDAPAQLNAATTLAAILRGAQDASLPRLLWTVSYTGTLIGEVHYLCRTPDDQRADITAWAEQLGVAVEQTDDDGLVRLCVPLTAGGSRIGYIRAAFDAG